MSLPPARPVYFGGGSDWAFGLLHRPYGQEQPATGVLLCPPWGWEEVASYRERRAWAEHLAGAGHAALRLDLPGSGDSGGSPRDPGRPSAWSAAIGEAAAWLQRATGCHRIVAVGLGLGGLLAAQASAEGAPIDELVLWATAARGRTFLRAERAFSRLQTSQDTSSGDPESGLPDGWLESGGFVLSADTAEALQALDIREMSLAGLGRALVLKRDGMGAGDAVRESLEAAGVAVTEAPGPGWGAMVAHPEQFEPPVEVFSRVRSWIAATPSPREAGAAHRSDPPGPERDQVRFEAGNQTLRESPLTLELGAERLFGVLAEPAGGAGRDLCAVFLNAGALRRVGPSRMWVEAARRFAAQGVPSLRVDFQAIGDADGDAGRYTDVGEFYLPGIADQVSWVIDVLEARGLGPRFLVVGLCSGAYWGFHAGVQDRRIVAACLLNSRALFWDPGLGTRREARKLARHVRPVSWRKILSGSVSAARWREILQTLAERAWLAVAASLRGLASRHRNPAAGQDLDGLLDRLRDRGTSLVLAFSGDEPLLEELRRDGVLERLGRWPNVRVADLPYRDHTLRPIAAQRAAHALLENELQRALQVEASTSGLSGHPQRPKPPAGATPRPAR